VPVVLFEVVFIVAVAIFNFNIGAVLLIKPVFWTLPFPNPSGTVFYSSKASKQVAFQAWPDALDIDLEIVRAAYLMAACVLYYYPLLHQTHQEIE